MRRSVDELRRSRRRGSFAAGLVLALVVAIGISAATVSAQDATPRQTIKQLRLLKDTAKTKRLWTRASRPQRVAGKKIAVHARKFRSVKLDTARLRSVLGARSARAHRSGAHEPARRLPSRRRTARSSASRSSESADHGSGPREAPSGDQDLQRSRHHDPTATIHADVTPARLPCLGAVGDRRLVHRPVLPASIQSLTRATTAAPREGHERHLRRA